MGSSSFSSLRGSKFPVGEEEKITDDDDPLKVLFNRCTSSTGCSFEGTVSSSMTMSTSATLPCSSSVLSSSQTQQQQCSFDHSSESKTEDEKRLNSPKTKRLSCSTSSGAASADDNAACRDHEKYVSFLRRKMKRLRRMTAAIAKTSSLVTLTLWMLTLHLTWSFLTSETLMVGAMNAESSSRGLQHFRRTPDNQTATVGDRVTLACSVENKAGVLQWTRDGFGLGTDRYLEGYDRYSMKISEDEGDFTLEIYPITLEDDAIFQCQVGPGADGSKELRSANAKLTVEVPTSPPEIINGDLLQTTEDKEVQLECISRGGKPAAEVNLCSFLYLCFFILLESIYMALLIIILVQITWIDGNNQEIKSGVESTKEPLDDGKRFNTRSILRFRPSKEHHNKTFTCQAHNRPAKEVMSTSIRIEVKYAPKVTVKILSPVIREFDNVRVSCRAEANPPDMLYRWILNDQVLPGDHGPTLLLPNVTRKYHDAIIKCEVQNAVGRSQESETLSVICKFHKYFLCECSYRKICLNCPFCLL